MEMKFFRVMFLLLVLVGLVGCGEDIGGSGEDVIQNSIQYQNIAHTPYANINELNKIKEFDNGVVDWRIARTFALIELETWRKDNRWYGGYLSKKPVVIYDGDSKPRYYEFRVVVTNSGYKEIGAITTVARKALGGPIVYALPTVRNYGAVKTKGPGFKILDCDYPSFGYGMIGKVGDTVSLTVNNQGESVVPKKDLGMDEITALVADNSNFLTTNSISISDAITIVQQKLQDRKEFNLKLWDSMASIETNLIILSTNDAFFKEMGKVDSKSWITTTTRQIVDPIIKTVPGWWDPDFLDKPSGLNWDASARSPNWCGPSVVGLIAGRYGKISKVKCRPGYDGYDKLGTLMRIDDWSNGGTYPSDVENALEWVTGFRYTKDNASHWWVFGTDKDDLWDIIKLNIDRRDPFAMMRGPGLGESIGHARCGIGYKEIKKFVKDYRWRLRIVKWKWYGPVIRWYKKYYNKHVGTERWTLLTDNGYERYKQSLGDREYLYSQDNSYCRNIFWEKVGTSAYEVLSDTYGIVYKSGWQLY